MRDSPIFKGKNHSTVPTQAWFSSTVGMGSITGQFCQTVQIGLKGGEQGPVHFFVERGIIEVAVRVGLFWGRGKASHRLGRVENAGKKTAACGCQDTRA